MTASAILQWGALIACVFVGYHLRGNANAWKVESLQEAVDIATAAFDRILRDHKTDPRDVARHALYLLGHRERPEEGTGNGER